MLIIFTAISRNQPGKLFQTAGLAGKEDEGCFDLGLVDDGDTMAGFLGACAGLRHWAREGLA